MGKYTNWIPKPIRRKLWPYKARLLGLPVEPILKVEQDEKDWTSLQETMRAFSNKYGTGYIPAMLAKGWEIPGKMFDELGGIFEQNRRLFILGDRVDVERLRKNCALAAPAQELLCDPGELERISVLTSCGYTTVVAYQTPSESEAVVAALTNLGKHFLNVNLFYEGDFIGTIPKTGDYCGMYAVYTEGKVYLKHQNVLVTTVCNLNCEYCLNYNPYNKHQKHFDLVELKRCVDIYFSHIDRVGFFELTGGEPALYPELQKLIVYIASNYRHKIDEFTFVTNGSTVFSDEFCNILKENRVIVLIDDYTETVPRLEANLTRLRDKLERLKVDFIIYPKVREFLKSFPPMRKNMELTEVELRQKYRDCTIGVQNLRDGRLCSCTYHAFAVNADLVPDDVSDWLDMNEMTDDLLSKKILIEFRCGFNQKGYTTWCRYCNGVQTINKNYAPAAEQVKGHLDWDINNPTYLD